jgi:YD repeat-containing protein
VTRTASYGYFANGLQSSLTTFSGQTVSFGYDQALRLTSQTDPNDSGRAVTFGYDSRSRRTSVTYGSGVSERLTYDKAGRVSQVLLRKSDATAQQRFDYYYGFDSSGVRQSDYATGFVKRVTELDGSQVTYGYDDLDRLTSATRSGTATFSHTYAYDLNNNRTGVTSGGTTTSVSYDNANQMTSLGGTSYSYDRNGNLTGFGGNSLAYDQSNKWTSGTVNGHSIAFGYDGHGRRTFRTVAGSRTDHWYDASGLTLETGANSATYLRDPDGLLLSKKTGGLYNYGRDRLGSITALTDTNQALARTHLYDPWGQSIGGSGSTYNPFQYTGTYNDGNGLYLIHAA